MRSPHEIRDSAARAEQLIGSCTAAVELGIRRVR